MNKIDDQKKKFTKLQERKRRDRFHSGIEGKKNKNLYGEERFCIIGNRSEKGENQSLIIITA